MNNNNLRVLRKTPISSSQGYHEWSSFCFIVCFSIIQIWFVRQEPRRGKTNIVTGKAQAGGVSHVETAQIAGRMTNATYNRTNQLLSVPSIAMTKDKNVQFVCFETELDSEQFVKRWKQYTRSLNTDVKVVLHQSGEPGAYQYIAEHFIEGAELQFIFSREDLRSKITRAKIKTSQAGGYHLAKEGNRDAGGKTKVFAFIKDPDADIDVYSELSAYSKPNIWEAYYQNCTYAYIIEYFISNLYAEELLAQLKLHKVDESGIYKEFTYKNDIDYNDIRKDHVWPK